MPEPSWPDRRGPSPEGGTRDAEDSSARRWARSVGVHCTVLLLVAAATALLVGHSFRFHTVVYAPGDIAREDVKAAADFLVEDPSATAARRRAAERDVSPVYDFHADALAASIGVLERALEAPPPRRGAPEGAARGALERHLGLSLPAEADRLLATPAGRDALLRGVRAALEGPYARGVVANRGLLAAEGARGVTVRNLATGQEVTLDDPGRVDDFDETRRRLEQADVPDPLTALARRLAAATLRPNLTYNPEETARRAQGARQEAGPVLYQVRRGEMLVREGDRVSEEQTRRLRAHEGVARVSGGWGRRGLAWGGLALAIGAVLAAVGAFGRAGVKKFRAAPRDLAFLGVVLVLWLALERAGMVVASGVEELIPALPASALHFALPMAAAAMVVRVVLNSETSLVFAVPYCALAALAWEHGLQGFLLLVAGCFAGAHRMARACRRVEFLRAGLWVGLAQVAVVWGFALFEGRALEVSALGEAAGALTGGLLSGVFALSAIPLAESGFGYTTDMRLMELASLDHPLLRSLMLRAPGTYHHAIVTGSLAKSAAEAIGARALLASVAAYYHDIGKLSKPAYFIENQAGLGNRHDKLAPSMSSLILTSHVKEGVELARRHRLGRDIAGVIEQHHGTSLIHYFYSKACQGARPGLGPVKEADYRYPGPKPRSREAALVLLADAVEAASRTLADPRPPRIRGLVQGVINRIFADGQLDECDLTLKDLHEIARSFTRILTGIHHQRIEYPLSPQKDRRPHGDLDSQRLAGGNDRRGEAPAAGGAGLRRLGM